MIESFRNELFAGYKTGDGIDPKLLAQFELAEDARRALGIVVWPMVEFEADDALATAAARFADRAARRAGRDLLARQGPRAVRARARASCASTACAASVLDEAGVHREVRRRPGSIPDLARAGRRHRRRLSRDCRAGARSPRRRCSRAYGHLEAIPDDPAAWAVTVRGAAALARQLARAARARALLYRRLATLRTDVPLGETLDDLRWRGPDDELPKLAALLADPWVLERARTLAARGA